MLRRLEGSHVSCDGRVLPPLGQHLAVALSLAEVFRSTRHLEFRDGSESTVVSGQLSVPEILRELDLSPIPGVFHRAATGVLACAMPSSVPAGSAVVISVGSVREHMAAREMATVSCRAGGGLGLVCIPSDLRNDGFLTNRYNTGQDRSGVAADTGAYPVLVVLDLEFIGAAGVERQASGVGEAIGLAVSFMDHLQFAHSRLEPEVQDWLLVFVDRLMSTWLAESAERLESLASSLLVKAFTMRLAGPNHVGAAADHLISYALERRGLGGDSHGARVLLGCIIADLLCGGSWLGAERCRLFVRFGRSQGFWTGDELKAIGQLGWLQLVSEAIKTRPNRPTSLKHVTREAGQKARQLYGVLVG